MRPDNPRFDALAGRAAVPVRRRPRGAVARCSLVLPLTLGLACAEPIPENVYVPAADYRQSLSISIETDSANRTRVGSWVILHARRAVGPWQLVPRERANLNDCWWRSPPPPTEDEVANNVRWRVDPPDSASFNIPLSPEAPRRVRLARPGRYLLWAESHGCVQPIISDTLAVTVTP